MNAAERQMKIRSPRAKAQWPPTLDAVHRQRQSAVLER
jgi:hypothetical protein